MKLNEKKNNKSIGEKLLYLGIVLFLAGALGVNSLLIVSKFISDGLSGLIASTLLSLIPWGLVLMLVSVVFD